jgi:glycosyltransferase involved in cell wall biosynthesis
MSMDKPFVVACVPAFNEERSIAGVVVQAKRYVDRVVVCDDGSVDLTGAIAEGLGAVVIRHERNMGYGASLRSLFREALGLKADYVVTLDSDGQHDPAEIPRLVERLRAGDVDVVIGSRFLDGGGSEAPGWRKAGINVITGLVANGGVKVTDSQSGFRAYNRGALESLTLTEEGMGLSTEILLKAARNGLKVAEVPIHVKYDDGSSTHNPVTHGLGVLLTTLKHLSINRPLLFYGIPGITALSFALIFWVWTLQIFAATREISTNVALIALGATTVGLMLMTTSIILWVVTSVVREKS